MGRREVGESLGAAILVGIVVGLLCWALEGRELGCVKPGHCLAGSRR